MALQPDARVFADRRWPGQVAQDGLLEEGYRRARRWLNPASDPRAPAYTKYRTLGAAGAALGYDIVDWLVREKRCVPDLRTLSSLRR